MLLVISYNIEISSEYNESKKMSPNIKQYKAPQAQTGAVRTYIRHGWIPTVVHMPYNESRRGETERQPEHYRPRNRYIIRKQNWVAWPTI